MAVLIPRKQIEEQNDISGSFRVGGDLSVTGSAVIGGSFAADSEFFLGNQLTDRGEITGSVFLTGSLTIDGDFSFEDVNRVLNVTASQAQQAQDTFRYGGILARDFGANVPTLYVSSTDGNDNNDGRSIQFPVRTVKKAAQLATPGFDGRYGLPSGSAFSGYVIRVQAGTYIEDNPVILPKNATIWGSGLRITKINARNPEQDLFHVNSGCYVAEVTMGGLRLFPNQIEPERGFAIAYQPGAFITTSPYIQNCSQISNQENSFAELYEDIPPGGGGLYVNGDAVHPDSPLASMVLDAYTQISPNGVGCLVNGRGFIQLVSFFTNFSYYAIRVNNGGHATLNNSNISFGLFGMYASGSRKIDSYEGGNEDAKLRVRRSYSAIVDVLNKGLEEGLPSITTLNTAEGIKVTQFSQSFSPDLASPKEVIQVGEDFRIISEIVNSGPKNYPTLLAKSSNIGYDIDNPYNISGGTQFSSSISASNNDILQISSSYRDLLSIFADGTGSYVFKSNNKDVIQISNLVPYSASFTASIGTDLYNNVSSSFDTVIKIVNKGRLPLIVSNASASLYLGAVEPILPSQPISSSIVSLVSSSFSVIYNILNNGTGSPILDVPQNHQTNFDMVRGLNNSGWVVNGGIQNNPNTGSNVFTVTNNGSGNYVINGQVNPTLNLVEGQTYVFNIAASGHPFWIKTTQTLGTGDQYNDGVTNNGTQSGTITFVVPVGAPTLYYNCQFHSSMRGVINIVEAGEEIPPVDDTEISNINPTITLFRGTKYLFNVSGSFSKSINRFFIRKEPVSGFLGEIDYSSTRNLSLELDYNDGVINNGDDFGVVTFTVPFNAPNELYYVSQNSSQMVGKFVIVNNSATPFNLIRSTMTYPTLVNQSTTASLVGDVTASYDILTNNLDFLKTETKNYISSSWAGFEYNTTEFNTEIDGIVTSVANDLLFSGNSGSISTGLDYYLNSTIESKIQKDVTLTAIKFLSDTSQNLLRSSSFELVDTDTDPRYLLRTSILKSKPFIQGETIAFLSSSWSEFEYNEVSCSRDTGFILNAVVTDLLYGGNERSVEAGDFYYRFPSITTSEQLSQTIDGIRYAGGTTLNIVEGNEFGFAETSTSASVALLRKNRQLIQTETIEFINASFPTLDYNQAKCRRDTGFILDAITTDLLYGGNERSVIAGNFYYQFPSVATTLQRRQTTAGIKYSKILADFIVQNLKLQTPRVSLNTEVGVKITNEANFTSSLFGTEVESVIVKSNFGIVSDIIKDGVGKIKKAVAKNKRPDWSVTTPINVTDTIQFTTTQSLVDFREEIGDSFQIVASIVSGGLGAIPSLEKSIDSLIKVNDIQQITGAFVEDYVTSSLSASFGLVVKIISNGVGVIPPIISNTDDNIFVGNDLPQTGSFINPSYITSVSQSYSVVTSIISGGLDVLPNVVKNTAGNVRTQNIQLFSSSLVATNTEVQFISQSFNIVTNILENGTGSLPTLVDYVTQSTSSIVLNAYQNIKNNIPFIQAETIAYLSSSWSEFVYNDLSCSRDIGFIVSGAAEDLLYNANSSSIVNGKFYFDFPSAAILSGSISPNEEAQLLPTLDGIRYAAQLTQKVILNTTFVGVDESDVEVANLLVVNKEFLRTEAIEYISSSWSFFNYNDLTCKRDIGFIIDAIATDLIYGGNERIVNAGEYYYEIPSQATGTQLIQTLEAINYVSSLSQKLIEGVEFVRPDGDVVEASRLLLVNNGLIGEEVVSYVSSSWSNVIYNELSCSRDIRHIINAARTDLVYGGNERSVIAGEFYFLYPSRATVGGIPSEEAQLDPTVTGIEYGSDLAQKIALSKVLTLVTSSKFEVVDVVRKNIQFIKNNTVEYVNAFYPFLQYIEEKCSRDVGFILDGVLTDLIYGGNQRSITSGDFYYRFPSLATAPSQKVETVDGILYAGEMTKLISINELIDNIVIGRNIDNTIKVGNVNQFISNQTGSFTEVLNVSSSFTLVTDIVESGVGSFTPTSASYNPANGEFVMTISNHGLKVGNIIYLRDESFVFTCTMDGNRTEHPLPSVGQPAYNSKLEIKSVTQNTITVNVGKSGPDVEFNPTDATYDPATGEFVVTVGEHDLSIGEGIVFVTRSFAFTCDMDNNHSTKSYPRFGIDPFSVRSIPITAVTEDTLTFNVGISGPNKFFTPTSASYDALTGEMILTVGQHGLGIGRGVVLVTGSIAFTCDQDNNQTTHSYPRSGSDPYAGKSIEIIDVGVSIHTVEDAPYNASTGITTLTISNHGFSNGDYIKISDNSLTYTCILDGNTIQKSYPRPGYDLPSGRWLEISNVTTNTFTIDIGPSSYVDSHTFITASANGLERQTGTFTINVGDGGSASGSIHTFVSASQDAVQHLPQSVHTFVSASAGALRHYPQAGHTFVRTTQNSVSTLPIVVENIDNTIKVTGMTQFTSSISASLQDIEFVSSSFGIVLDIVKNGSGSYQPTQYGTASTDVNTLAAYGLLIDNIPFIQGETIAYISSSWSDFGFYPISASREIELIVSGAAEDLLHGVASASIVNGKYFFEVSSSATISGSFSPNESAQLFPTLDGIRYASRLSDKLIKNILFQTASLEISASNVLITENRNFIKEEMIAYLSSSWSDFDYNEITCKRDIGFVLDAVRTDLVYGGNERSVNAGEFYYRFPSAAITGGNVSPTTDAQLFPTLDGIRYAGDVTQKLVSGSVFQTASLEVSASVNLLRKNRAFIQAETVEYVSSSWSDVVYNVLSCSRDTGFILDGVITDLLYGGEERSVNAGDFYYLFPSRATVGGIPSEAAQLDPTLAGIRYAGGISSKIVLNQQFSFPSQSVLNGRSLLQNNKEFIQKETIAFLSSSWSGLKYNEQTASRELGFIIDAAATDLVYGGNESSIEIGNYYYTNPTLAIVDSYADNFGLKKQTVSSINFARGLSEKVVNQTQLVFPGVRRLEAAVRLVNAKGELQRRALSYTNGAFPALVYNEASCSRDTGLIVDSLATDLIYGGNERGIEAATSYFNGQYGSGAEVVDNQRLETLETNRYLRTRAEFIVANAPKEDFGSLIVATGIDYSYNGSGVTFKALPPNQGGSGIPNPDFEITELGGGRIFFTSGNQDGDFRIGTGLSINQATGTLVGRTFSKSLFSLVTPFSLALEG